MDIRLGSLSDPALAGFDTLIDTRAPSEYAEDHLPGAINLPVLDDAQRARVGTIYKQESPFKARKVGGALVARNAAAHLEGPLAEMGGGWRPLVYCWRGGQRSGSFTTILQSVGWRAEVLAGGYKTYRRLVVAALYDTPFPAPVVVLDLQSLLVMALCIQRGRRQMVVLQRHWAPAAWGDLRRAVYSVAHPTPDAADNQMP